MALFTDVYYNESTGKHELQFVNQQYDFLMGIVWNEKTGKYALNCSEAEAVETFKSWGNREFNLKEWVDWATTELPKRDAEKAAAKKAGTPDHDTSNNAGGSKHDE